MIDPTEDEASFVLRLDAIAVFYSFGRGEASVYGHYRVRGGSLNAHCDATISACSVFGIVDWEVGSTNRNTKSSGSASFIYG
jgi:hypothetical protein